MRVVPRIAILTLLALPAVAHAAWGPSGSPICTAPGFQGELFAIPLPSASAVNSWTDLFAVWGDARDTTTAGSNVYFKVVVPWDPATPPPDGDPVVIAPVFQGDPVAAFTGYVANHPPSSGGVVVAWTDNRNGDVDVYAKRVIDSPFNVPWPATGVPVCAVSGPQFAIQVVGDFDAGATFAWLDGRTGFNSVYAQRVDRDGVPQWALNGIPVCAEAGYRWNLKSARADNGGGMYLVWTDDRPGTIRAFALRLLPDGTPAPGWPASGLQVSTLTAASLGPVVSDGAGGIYVTFGSGLGVPVVSRLDGNGTVHPGWPANGVPLAATPFTGGIEDAIAYGDGLVAVWSKNILPPDDYLEFDLVAQRLLGNGTRSPGWDAEGNVLCSAAGNQGGARLAAGAPAILATWEDERPGSQGTDLYAMRLTDSGGPDPFWPVNGVAIATVNGRQMTPRPVWDHLGGVMIAYVDDHDFNSFETDIEVQRVNLDGSVGTTGVRSGAAGGPLRLGAPVPNPARAAVSLALAGNSGVARVVVADALGRQVRSLASAGGALRWDLCDDAGRRVAPGVYWVHVRDRAGEATRAVVVRK